jgi:hypothetical protein
VVSVTTIPNETGSRHLFDSLDKPRLFRESEEGRITRHLVQDLAFEIAIISRNLPLKKDIEAVLYLLLDDVYCMDDFDRDKRTALKKLEGRARKEGWGEELRMVKYRIFTFERDFNLDIETARRNVDRAIESALFLQRRRARENLDMRVAEDLKDIFDEVDQFVANLLRNPERQPDTKAKINPKNMEILEWTEDRWVACIDDVVALPITVIRNNGYIEGRVDFRSVRMRVGFDGTSEQLSRALINVLGRDLTLNDDVSNLLPPLKQAAS